MIAKISATENLGGALGYNFKKENKKEATLLLAHGLYQNYCCPVKVFFEEER